MMENWDTDKLRTVTQEQEEDIIKGCSDLDFFAAMHDEFGSVRMATLIGWATLYGLTGKKTPTEARLALVGMGFSSRSVYAAYADFRRLRRGLLARRGVAMREGKGGPGMNGGVPLLISRVQCLQSA
jgi:hypothetical protein